MTKSVNYTAPAGGAENLFFNYRHILSTSRHSYLPALSLVFHHTTIIQDEFHFILPTVIRTYILHANVMLNPVFINKSIIHSYQ